MASSTCRRTTSSVVAISVVLLLSVVVRPPAHPGPGARGSAVLGLGRQLVQLLALNSLGLAARVAHSVSELFLPVLGHGVLLLFSWWWGFRPWVGPGSCVVITGRGRPGRTRLCWWWGGGPGRAGPGPVGSAADRGGQIVSLARYSGVVVGVATGVVPHLHPVVRAVF